MCTTKGNASVVRVYNDVDIGVEIKNDWRVSSASLRSLHCQVEFLVLISPSARAEIIYGRRSWWLKGKRPNDLGGW